DLLFGELDLLAHEGSGVGGDRLHQLHGRLLVDRRRLLLALAWLLHLTHLLSDSYPGRQPAARIARRRSPAVPAPPVSPRRAARRRRRRSAAGCGARVATASEPGPR